MTKHRGPADAANNGEHIHPTNTSRSRNKGGGVIREAHRGVEGREFHIGGGAKDPFGEPTHEQQRSLEEHAKDVAHGGKMRQRLGR